MDLFGLKSHDERHEQTELTLRRLVEQVGQLSIDLGQTRTDMRRIYLMLQGKVDSADVDPALVAANDALGRARDRLSALQAAADEQWNVLSTELDAALAEANEKAEGLPEEG